MIVTNLDGSIPCSACWGHDADGPDGLCWSCRRHFDRAWLVEMASKRDRTRKRGGPFGGETGGDGCGDFVYEYREGMASSIAWLGMEPPTPETKCFDPATTLRGGS